MTNTSLYEERVSSSKTQALFWTLTALFSLLFAWGLISHVPELLTAVLLLVTLLFLFYSLNYQVLVIRITSEALRLHFGIFTWTIPRDNIQGVAVDDLLPLMAKYGGAGIHFLLVRGRYRASLNFLEFPRVVVALKRAKVVRDVSFSTRHPHEVIRHLNALIETHGAADHSPEPSSLPNPGSTVLVRPALGWPGGPAEAVGRGHVYSSVPTQRLSVWRSVA